MKRALTGDTIQDYQPDDNWRHAAFADRPVSSRGHRGALGEMPTRARSTFERRDVHT
jgi:hypothetical protein